MGSSNGERIICSVCLEEFGVDELPVSVPAIGFMHQDCKPAPWSAVPYTVSRESIDWEATAELWKTRAHDSEVRDRENRAIGWDEGWTAFDEWDHAPLPGQDRPINPYRGDKS